MLLLVLYGLRAGWSTPRQWSDGLIVDAVAQMMVAGLLMMTPPGEALDASSLRYIARSDILWVNP